MHFRICGSEIPQFLDVLLCHAKAFEHSQTFISLDFVALTFESTKHEFPDSLQAVSVEDSSWARTAQPFVACHREG